MAQRTTVTLLDDLDQSEADETVEFGLDGVSYEIDLSAQRGDELRSSPTSSGRGRCGPRGVAGVPAEGVTVGGDGLSRG